jgi:hypothetical protein
LAQEPIKTTTDLKRIAICGGGLGRENRYFIRGQVVDVGINDVMKADGLWDLVTGLFQEDEFHLTPALDFSLAPVRKPILRIEIYNEEGKLSHKADNVFADEDGFFSIEFRTNLPAGRYQFRIILTGLDSYRQYRRDLKFINKHGESELARAYLLSRGNLTILAENSESLVTTSDIDQTYLATEIHTPKGKLSALFETPLQKRPLPGMPALYKVLREDTNNTPLVFISASPHFFRRTMLATIKNHGVNMEALHLKYLDGTVKGVVDKILGTVLNPKDFLNDGFSSAMDRTKKFLTASYQSLFDQMSYKLTILLQDRLYLPKNTKEILMGDNTESDYMIFTLYQLISEGKLSGIALEDFLYELNFLGRDAITRDAARKIRELADENMKFHGPSNPVKLCLINHTVYGPNPEKMKSFVEVAIRKIIPDFDLESNPYFFGTEGSIGFSVLLHAFGHIEFTSVFEVIKSLGGEWVDGKVIDEEYLLNWVEHLSVPKEAHEAKLDVMEVLKRALI